MNKETRKKIENLINKVIQKEMRFLESGASDLIMDKLETAIDTDKLEDINEDTIWDFFIEVKNEHEELKANIFHMIDRIIQKELHCDTDNITSEGWTFLESEAPGLIMDKIENEIDADEWKDIDEDVIWDYLDDVTSEYEQNNPNIRYH